MHTYIQFLLAITSCLNTGWTVHVFPFYIERWAPNTKYLPYLLLWSIHFLCCFSRVFPMNIFSQVFTIFHHFFLYCFFTIIFSASTSLTHWVLYYCSCHSHSLGSILTHSWFTRREKLICVCLYQIIVNKIRKDHV